MKKANLESVLASALKKATRGVTSTPNIEETSLRDDELAQVQGAGIHLGSQRPPIVPHPVETIDWLTTNPFPRPEPPPPEPPDDDWTEIIDPDPNQPPPPPPEPGPPIPWDPNPFPPDPEPSIQGALWESPPDFPVGGGLRRL